MRAGQGQTLIDVAAQVCGSAELAWDIAVRSGFGLTDIPGNAELDVPTDGGDRDTAAEMAAPMRYVTVSAPKVCASSGMDLAQM